MADLYCAFLGEDQDAARACGVLREAGISAELAGDELNAAPGFFGGDYPGPLGGSTLARVMVAAADRERARALLADFACGHPVDVAEFGLPLASAADRFDDGGRHLIADLVAEAAAIYGDRLQAVKLVGSRARGDARPDSDWDFLLFLDSCDYELEVPRLAELAAALERRHGCAELSISPMSREQFLGLDAKYEGITERFRRDAVALWPVLRSGQRRPES